jgi:membrane protease YdiL (CAAX protease family)
LKKGIVSFLHSLVYPLIYMGSQLVASFVAIIAYAVSTSINGITDGIFNRDVSALQQEFMGRYNHQILIAACVITCLVILIIIRAGRRKLKDVLIIRPLPAGTAVLVFITGITINMATVFALTLLPIPESIIEQYNELVRDNIMTDNIWLTLLTTALLIPITEELVFRGMSFNVLRRGMAMSLAVIFQTLIFAAAHMLPLQITYVLPTALVLGLVYVWCDSILAPIILHISYNGFSAVLSFLPAAESDAAGAPEAAGAVSVVIMAASAIITVACLLRIYGKYRTRKRMLAERKAYPGDGN